MKGGVSGFGVLTSFKPGCIIKVSAILEVSENVFSKYSHVTYQTIGLEVTK